MFQKLLSIAILSAAFATLAIAADEPAPGKKGLPGAGFDKTKVFEKMDADGNGSVDIEEFKKFRTEMAKRMAEKGNAPKTPKLPAGVDVEAKIFERIDSNGDGKVTMEEFEKINFGAPGGFKGKGKGNFDPEKLKELQKKRAEKQ